MDLTLVPFGYLTAQNKLVDVHQVLSGKRCGCLCPSCHAPLIARKGNKKIWHFAHDSQSEIVTKLGRCSYSFFVSARMMALQLFDEQLSIILPKFEIQLSEYLPHSGRHIHVSQTVTESKRVVVDAISVDKELLGNKVDLLGYVNGYPLAIVFTHPGRKNQSRYGSLQDQKAGVLEISLNALKDRFRTMDSGKQSYSDVLEDYISNDIASKKWVYHPRLHLSENLAKSELDKKIASAHNHKKQLSNRSAKRPVVEDKLFKGLKDIQVTQTKHTRFSFICRLCNSSWSGTGEDAATCLKCGSSLLVSRNEVRDSDT